MSHSIIRTILPTGHLYTYDFHEQRVETVNKEFSTHGISDMVTCTQRDVCKDGFTLHNQADAVFLDLPRPWDVIKHAKNAIKIQGKKNYNLH